MTRKKPELSLVPTGAGSGGPAGGAGGGGGDPPGPAPEKRGRQFIGDFMVPYAFEVWGDGLYHVEAETSDDPATPDMAQTPCSARRTNLRIVCRAPVWIRRFGRALDTGEQLIEVAFKDAITQEVITLWVDRVQIANKTTIVKLSRAGLPVNENNAPQVIQYLNDGLYLNGPRLEVVQILSRAGALTLPEGPGWLVGERWIGPDNTRVVCDPRNQASFSKGYTVSGDEAEWKSMFLRLAQRGPEARWLIYSTFAAPLLSVCNQRTFIVHHWGPSGGGKSALAKFAMAAWGDPQLLLQTFNRTEKSFIEMFNYLSDMPVLFDELQAANAADVSKIIYALTLEKGRGRSTQVGGLQKELTEWKSVIRMTGEEPLIGKDGVVDLGGQSNRVVQISAVVLDEPTALEVHQWCDQKHFGWGAVRFLTELGRVISTDAGKHLVQSRFTQIRSEIARRVTTPHAHARVGHFAIVALAQYMTNRWIFEGDPECALEGAIADAVAVAEGGSADEVQESLPQRVLQLFHDHHTGHRHLWFDLDNEVEEKAISAGTYKQLFGVVTPTEIWLLQRPANELLQRSGIPARRAWSDLLRAGVLMRPASAKARGAFAAVRRRGKFQSKVYVFSRLDLDAPSLENPFAGAQP